MPKKNAPPTESNIRDLENALTSVIAYHAGSVYPWTFYEKIDEYLGPWGMNGYPIAYGKYYCIAFNSNQKLQDNSQTRSWVHRTTIALQEPIKNMIVEKFKSQKLASLTEQELRAFAFAEHPKAYTKGGLAMVLLAAPELLPVIATIPSAEFSFSSQNFSATWNQVFSTIGMVAPEVVGSGLAAFAGPAHTGILSRAIQRDHNAFMQDQYMVTALARTLQIVQDGQMDNITLLNKLIYRLNTFEYPDQGMATYAASVVRAANQRKRYVRDYYRKQISLKPSMQSAIIRFDPGWEH